MYNFGTSATVHTFGGFRYDTTATVYVTLPNDNPRWPEPSVEFKLERRLKQVEKEMIKYPRRMDLKLEAIQLRKDLKAIKMKEKK